MGPEIIIRIKDEPTPRPVKFEELFALKDKLQSVTLLWDYNSYHVNIDRRCFMINGGRRIGVSQSFKKCNDLRVFYRRRNQQDLVFGGSQDNSDSHRVSYLLGLVGEVDGVEKLTFLQVSDDGIHWVWRDHK